MSMLRQTNPRVLLVEGDDDTARAIVEALEARFGAHSCERCDSAKAARQADVTKYSLVLADMQLPDGDGLTLLEHWQARRTDLPVIFLTAEHVIERAVAAIEQGAYDYIIKAGDYLHALPLLVEKNLAVWRTQMENERLQRQLSRTLEELRRKNDELEAAVEQLGAMASTDPLTGLANRRAFAQAIERSFAEASRHGHDLACIMIDLDGFKQLNDTHGHQAGDELLARAGAVLQACCRRSDLAARFGGDEFVLLLPQADEKTATRVASRINDGFAHVVRQVMAGTDTTLTMSMGLACLHRSRPRSPEQMIAHADHALYRAKQSGKNRLEIYDPTDRKALAELHTTAHL